MAAVTADVATATLFLSGVKLAHQFVSRSTGSHLASPLQRHARQFLVGFKQLVANGEKRLKR